MSWREIDLGEAIRVKHGFAFKSQHFSDSGNFMVLTPGNFNEEGGFRRRPSKDRFYSADIPDGYILEEGDLVVVMTEQGPGLLGSAALVPEGGNYLHNQRPFPADVGLQIRIASVLSAYDDLIENNRRRIRLLEQSARLLYEEWFVRLRFPGHEKATVIDGVPEGWTSKTIGEVSPFKYGKALRKDARVPGPYPVFGSSGTIGSHSTAMVQGPGIIIGRKGNVGSVFWCTGGFFPIDTVYYVDREHCTPYVFYALLHTRFINTDVAVPGLNRHFAHSRELRIPDDDTKGAFDQQMWAIHGQVDQLTRQNTVLAQARNLLVPRLMSGEITV